MELSMAISPVAGAIIGYFTNWLAIKMLFKPHEERRLLGIKLPFTPGLIPKEKARLARNLGGTVGNNILTEEVLLKELQTPQVQESLERILEDGYQRLKNSEVTVEQALQQLFQKNQKEIKEISDHFCQEIIGNFLTSPMLKEEISNFIYEKVKMLLSCPLHRLPLEKVNVWTEGKVLEGSIWLSENEEFRQTLEMRFVEFYQALQKDERKLQEILPESSLRALQREMEEKAPLLAGRLVDFADTPEASEAFAPLIKQAIIRVTGKFAAVFIDEEKVYRKILESAREYLDDENNKEKLVGFVNSALQRGLDHTVQEASQAFKETVFGMTAKGLDKALEKEALEKFARDILQSLWRAYESRTGETIGSILHFEGEEFDKRLQSFIAGSITNIFQKNGAEIYSMAAKWENMILQGSVSRIIGRCKKETWEKGKKGMHKIFQAALKFAAPYGVKAIDIPRIVEEQINSLEMNRIEELVLEIARKELNAITIVGGVLGFIIGCVPVVLQLTGI